MRLQEDIREFDLDEYLPAITADWCRTKLQDLGFDPTSSQGISEFFRTTYLQLREAVLVHITSGAEPQLGLCVKPTGALNWEPTEAFVRDIQDYSTGEPAILEGEGEGSRREEEGQDEEEEEEESEVVED